jgi:hypothetical protein
VTGDAVLQCFVVITCPTPCHLLAGEQWLCLSVSCPHSTQQERDRARGHTLHSPPQNFLLFRREQPPQGLPCWPERSYDHPWLQRILGNDDLGFQTL